MVFLSKNIWLRSFIALWSVECKLFVRQPIAAFFTFVFPVLIFLMFGFIFGERPLWNRPDLSHIDFYAPALMAAYVSQAGLISLPVFLANYRQVGILKRYVVSPISIGTYLSVHTAVQFVIFLISSAILIVTAEGVFDIQFRGHWAVVLCVGTACISCFFTLASLSLGSPNLQEAFRLWGNSCFLSCFLFPELPFQSKYFQIGFRY